MPIELNIKGRFSKNIVLENLSVYGHVEFNCGNCGFLNNQVLSITDIIVEIHAIYCTNCNELNFMPENFEEL